MTANDFLGSTGCQPVVCGSLPQTVKRDARDVVQNKNWRHGIGTSISRRSEKVARECAGPASSRAVGLRSTICNLLHD